MAARQAFAGQKGRKQDDQQWPQIGDQAGLGRRRQAQCSKIQRVIAKKAADPERPDRPGLAQRRKITAPEAERQPAAAADRESHRGHLERRNPTAGGGEQRQARP
jgi:hypothetical protein